MGRSNLTEIDDLRGRLKPRARLLGLDVGSKTIGLALSNGALSVATPFETIRRSNLKKDTAALLAAIVDNRVGGLVVGLPINMNGSEGPRCQSVRQSGANLAPAIPRPVTPWDQRLASAPVVLFVPSLINRCYILDLSRRRSLMRDLADHGIRPLLMDWGRPGADERGFDLTDYTAGRLEAALDAATEISGGAVTVAGYCMGGLLALALAQRRPGQVRALALLATPWDFHATENHAPDPHALLLGALAAPLDGLLAALGELPIDALQALFTWSDPTMVANKFRALAGRDPAGPEAEDFVALEDWLNDGVALTASVARECLIGWYGENRPARGQWRIAGQTVRPESLDLPSLLAIPRRDRIVPPASALALAEAMPNAVRLTPPAGHIGMVIGRSAREGLWKPLESWLKSV